MKRLVLATPYARKLAEDMKIDIANVKGTGEYSSIVSEDILNHSVDEVKATSVAKNIASFYNIDLDNIEYRGNKLRKSDVLKLVDLDNVEGTHGVIEEHTLANQRKASPMRKMIAKRMTESMATAPQYTLFSEMDTTELFKLIENTNETYKTLVDGKFSVTDFMIKLVAKALEKHDIINSCFKEDIITINEDINIGVAVALDDGLIVPVIKNANKLGLIEINKEAKELYTKARDEKLMPSECSFGTFTISNMGMFPIQYATPIINQPESGILAIGQTIEKPGVVDGEIAIRKYTGFSLTLDHRHVDGAEGCKFFKTLKELIDRPLSLLI